METLLNLLASNTGIVLGYTIFHSVWQSAIILGIVLILNRLDIKANLKYNLNIVALALQFIISILTFNYYNKSVVLGTKVFIDTIDFAGPIVQVISTSENGNVFVSLWAWCQMHMHILVGLWLVGMGLQMARLLFNINQIQFLKNSNHLPVSQAVTDTFTQLRFKFWITKPIRIFNSTKVTTPMVIGHIKPIILLPVALCAQLSITELEAILAHELAHIKRNDYLHNLVQSFFETIFFFNPAFLFISNMARIERELACDQLATAHGVGELHLAKALLQVAQYNQDFNLGMAFGRKTNALTHRIKLLLGIPQQNGNFGKIILIALVLMGTTFWYINAQRNTDNQSSKNNIELNSITQIAQTKPDTTEHKRYINNNGKTLIIEQKGGKIIANGKVYQLTADDSLKMIALQKRYNEVENEIENKTQNIEIIAQQIESKMQIFDKKNGLENANHQRVEEAQKQIEAVTKEMEAMSLKMEGKLKESERKNMGKTAKNKNWEQYNKEHEAYMKDYHQKMSKYEKEIEKYAQVFAQYEIKNEGLVKDLEQIEKEMAIHEAPLAQLSNELEKLATDMVALYPLEVKKALRELENIGVPHTPKPPRAPKQMKDRPNLPAPPVPPAPASRITPPNAVAPVSPPRPPKPPRTFLP